MMKIRTVVAAAAAAALASLAMACVPDPPPPTTTTSTTALDPWEPPQCWEAAAAGTAATYYTGPENTLNNASYAFPGENCARLIDVPLTYVRAPDQAAANALCQSLTSSNATKMTNESVNPPDDGWRCF